ncbi:hypothetical protein EGW08_006821, partial [Elysia chlorotica]
MATENGILIQKQRKLPPLPQDEGWSWMIVLGVFIYAFFMVGIAKSYGLFLLAFMEHFGVSVAFASLPLVLSGILYAFGAPTALIISEKYNARWVVIFGAVAGMIGIAISSALISMEFVVLFFGVWYGIGNSCFYGNGLVTIGKYFKKRRSVATGIGLAGASIGQFAMPPIIEFLLRTYGLSGTLFILAALYSHAAISGALFRPLSMYGPPLKEVVPQAKLAGAEAEESGKKTEGETKVFVQIRDELADSENGDVNSLQKNGEPAASSSPVSLNGKAGFPNPELKNGRAAEENQPLHHAGAESCAPHNQKSGNPDQTAETHDQYYSEASHKEELLGRDNKDGEAGVQDDNNDDADDDMLLERKAFFASTGSVFLVSPTVQDIRDVDNDAREFSPLPLSAARLRREKRKALCLKINSVFDFRVLRSYITIFYTINCFVCFFGYFSHILFLPGIVQEKGILDYKKALLISMCGAGDLISRVSTGFFADMNLVPRYRISALACILCGLNIALTLPARGFEWLAVHCFFYGYFGGAYVSLLSVVLLDMVGLAMMSKNLAVILLIQGIGSSLGQMFL